MANPPIALPPELAPYAQDLEEFKQKTRIRLSFPPLGTGGGGTVLKAEDSYGRHMAVKVIAAEDAASRDQALREADILKQVQQAKALGGGQGLLWRKRSSQVDLFFLGMDFIPGSTLTELLAAQGSLPQAVAVELAIGIAEELEELHQQQIIHRDIKPDNVILLKLGRRFQPIVVDYGIAKVGNRTSRGARAATDGYAPPEQYKGGTDRRTDVYALGATLYEMVTGQTPPVATSRDPRQDLEPRQYNPAISLELELVIHVATAYYAQQRFATMEALIEALRLVQAENVSALWTLLQTLKLLPGGWSGAPVAQATSVDNLPQLPPLPMKRQKARPRAGGLECPFCQNRCPAGEAFCGHCGMALDSAIQALPAPVEHVALSEVEDAGNFTPCTPGPQFVSLVFAHQIVLGGPELDGVGKAALILAYWLLLAAIALGGRSLSIACSLVSGVTIGCSALFFLLFLLFAKIWMSWDETIITRRGQAHWLHRAALLLVGLAGLGGSLYWLVNQVAIWNVAWYMTPPPLSILVYAGVGLFASVMIKALLA